jgi:hypothetical protein
MTGRAMLASWMLALSLAACDGEPALPPGVARDVATLRRVMIADPAARPIEEAERIADERPVLAGRMVRSAAIPAAHQQVEAVRAAEMTSEQGRTLARRLREAYEERERGLELWERYLHDAATDDELLLESTTALREAEMDIIGVDRELETLVPTEAPPRESGGERER